VPSVSFKESRLNILAKQLKWGLFSECSRHVQPPQGRCDHPVLSGEFSARSASMVKHIGDADELLAYISRLLKCRNSARRNSDVGIWTVGIAPVAIRTDTYQSLVVYILQQWYVFSSQTANGMQWTIVNQCNDIQVFQLLSIPLHVWNKNESSLHVWILKYDSLDFSLFLQYIVHPLQHVSTCMIFTGWKVRRMIEIALAYHLLMKLIKLKLTLATIWCFDRDCHKRSVNIAAGWCIALSCYRDLLSQLRNQTTRFSSFTNAQYTPPTPTRLNCRVESRRRCVLNSRLVGDSLDEFRRVWTIRRQRSRVASCRRCVRTSRQSWPSFQFSAPVIGYWG